MSTCPIHVECHLVLSKIAVFLCTSKWGHLRFSTNMGSRFRSLGTREFLDYAIWEALLWSGCYYPNGHDISPSCIQFVDFFQHGQHFVAVCHVSIFKLCQTCFVIHLMDTAALRLLCITLLLDAASPSMTKCHGLNHMCLCGITEVGQSLWVDVLMC